MTDCLLQRSPIKHNTGESFAGAHKKKEESRVTTENCASQAETAAAAPQIKSGSHRQTVCDKQKPPCNQHRLTTSDSGAK